MLNTQIGTACSHFAEPTGQATSTTNAPETMRPTVNEAAGSDVIVAEHKNNRCAGDHIVGRGGVTIQDAWRDGMTAHLGTTVAGFPNLFMVMGPNSGGGAQSILFVIEHSSTTTTGISNSRRVREVVGGRCLT